MKIALLLTLLAVVLWTCQHIPAPADKIYHIEPAGLEKAEKPLSCSFRYRIDNAFGKLDNQSQQDAVRAAFDLWQNATDNLLFLQKQDGLNVEIAIRFAEAEALSQAQEKSTSGLIRGILPTLSGVVREGGVYTILLNNSFEWDNYALTRVVAYHIGKFLGLSESPENGSMVNRTFLRESLRLSPDDSLIVNALYATPCAGDCNGFLPLSLGVLETVTKSIRVEKPGKVTISATGSMIVGYYLGWSTPVGLEKGLLGIPIGDYSIERAYFHGCLIYKINNEKKWRSCGAKCEFETDGVSQCIDVTLGVNDLNITDNSGKYNVVIDYKQ